MKDVNPKNDIINCRNCNQVTAIVEEKGAPACADCSEKALIEIFSTAYNEFKGVGNAG